MTKPNDLAPKGKGNFARRRWTEAEREKIRDLLLTGLPNDEIARQLDRSARSITVQMMQMGITRADFGVRRKRVSAWSADDKAHFIRLWPTTSTKEIAHQFGCTQEQAYKAARTFGLKRGENQISIKYWSPEESNKLAEMWASSLPISEISKEMGRSVQSIKSHARIMGLKKNTRGKRESFNNLSKRILEIIKIKGFIDKECLIEISEELKVSMHYVMSIVKKLQIKVRRKKCKNNSRLSFCKTPHKVKKFIELYNNGISLSDIAKYFDISYSYAINLSSRFAETGQLKKRTPASQIHRNILNMYIDGASPESISIKLGITLDAVLKKIKRVGVRKTKESRRFTEEEIEVVERYHHAGCTAGCIANRINITKRRALNIISMAVYDENHENYRIISDLHKFGLEARQISIKTELPVGYVKKIISITAGGE